MEARDSAIPHDVAQRRDRVERLIRERDQLLRVVDLQRELGTSLQVAELLQRLARRLGALFGLDCDSNYLAGEESREVRLVATYADPTLRNLIVELGRYLELAHAFVAFLRRLVTRYAQSDQQSWAETLLPRESNDRLDRLVSVAMQVIEREAKG